MTREPEVIMAEMSRRSASTIDGILTRYERRRNTRAAFIGTLFGILAGLAFYALCEVVAAHWNPFMVASDAPPSASAPPSMSEEAGHGEGEVG